jgi:hypothetical protein
VGFEPTISAVERPQAYVLDRAATGTGIMPLNVVKYTENSLKYKCLRKSVPRATQRRSVKEKVEILTFFSICSEEIILMKSFDIPLQKW